MSVTALECVSYWHLADIRRSQMLNMDRSLPTWALLWNGYTNMAHNAARVLSELIPPANDPLYFTGGDAA